ncbi:MAG: TetR/AcrR family transcriptional regulator [Rubrivivax sp.]|nr:MAG: TetR/AcrR family transcriptional regulator [Rubrivivax sp.]
MRKQPTQERAHRTIGLIFEATAQIVDKEGAEALSTNKIARLAGVSIGTLYQYFPTKEAIIVAMVSQEQQRVMTEMHAMLSQVLKGAWEPEAFIQARVRVLVRSFGAGTQLNRAMVRLAWHMDHHEQVAQSQREAAEHLGIALARINHPELRAPSPVMLFVATRAVIGVIRSASLEKSPLLDSAELEDELARMVWALFRAG